VSEETEGRSWEALLRVRLRSVQSYGGGLGPDGPVQEHKYLTLSTNGTFELETADIAVVTPTDAKKSA
jgi:hypothetical protein